MFHQFLHYFVVLVVFNIITHSEASTPNPYWDDVTSDEMESIQNYMFKAFPNLVPIEKASLKNSYIFSIGLAETDKKVALKQQSDFNRAAKVVIFFASEPGCVKCPYVGEFLVYPTSKPVKHINLAEKSFSKRPISNPEEHAITKVVAVESARLSTVLQAAYDATFNLSCSVNTPNCLTYMYTTPFRRPSEKGRTAWLRLHRNFIPVDHHPVDLQFLLAFDGSDLKQWKVLKFWMQGKYFQSSAELLQSFKNGSFVPVKRPFVEMPVYLVDGATTAVNQPQEPSERNFVVSNNSVSFYKWNFHIAFRSTTGLRLFNTKFDGKSIAYEIGLAEAVSVYSGFSPFIQSTFFVETQWGMGSFASNLWPGKDCPIDALYLPVTVYTSGTPRKIERGICIFEHHVSGTNIKRHAEYDFHYPEDAYYYNADEDRVLIVRSISTMFNYDYIFDYEFHKTGAVTSRAMLTGNIFTDLRQDGQGNDFGYPLQQNPQLYGPLHHHLFSYKVDLDIMEAESNILKQVTVDKQKFADGIWNQVLRGKVPRKEKDAQMEYDRAISAPRMTYICYTGGGKGSSSYKAELYKNSSSLPCYKIVNHGMSKSQIPNDVYYEKGISWARYPISVTKRKDSEWLSTSIYTCVDPVEPDVNFQDFIEDNENIVDEDLVAWITMGHQHPPVSEDLPQTTTPNAKVSFQITGANFHTRSPEP